MKGRSGYVPGTNTRDKNFNKLFKGSFSNLWTLFVNYSYNSQINLMERKRQLPKKK